MNHLSIYWIDLLACPNCKEALDDQVAAGYAWSIGLMMLVPMTILVMWAFVIVRTMPKTRPGP